METSHSEVKMLPEFVAHKTDSLHSEEAKLAVHSTVVIDVELAGSVVQVTMPVRSMLAVAVVKTAAHFEEHSMLVVAAAKTVAHSEEHNMLLMVEQYILLDLAESEERCMVPGLVPIEQYLQELSQLQSDE